MNKIYQNLILWLSRKDSASKFRNAFFLFFATFTLAGIAYYYAMNEVETSPCSPTQYPGRCYRIPENICQSQWDRSAQICEEQIKNLQLSPTRLIGPIRFKCQVAHLDRMFSSTRTASNGCNELHTKLDQWKITNPDF